jgi:autoinducer 2-degrading protein
MYIVSVTVHVKPDLVPQFIEAILDNARNTRKEPGNVRFDVSQAEDDPARFLLYEVYHSKDDFTAHQRTPHYARFRDAVAEWMAQPRVGVRHRAIYFGESDVRAS